MADYIIPFSLDALPFLNGLNKMDEGADKLAASVTDAGKKMQEGFMVAANAGDNLGKKLDASTQKALGLRDAAGNVGKTLGAALAGNDVGKGLEDRLTKVNKLIEGTGGKKGFKIDFDIDTAKLEHFEQELANGADSFKVLSEVVDVAKQKLATLGAGPEFDALSQQIQTAEGLLNAFGSGADVVSTKSKSLKTQLREMEAALAQMEMQGKDNTAEFIGLSVAAGKVKDQIGDISNRVRVLASDTKYIDAGIQAVGGLVGAFTAAQGAAALFGSENENLQKVIAKVTGAMALLQGVQAVANALNKDSALSVLLFGKAEAAAIVGTEGLAVAEGEQAVAAGAATVATKTWTAALLSNPIFLIVAAVAALVTAFVAFTDGSAAAAEATDKLNTTLERQNQLMDLDEGAITRRTNILVAQAKLQGKSESDLTIIEGQALAKRVNLRRDRLEETRGLLNDESSTRKLSVEDFKKLQDTEVKQTEDYENGKAELQVKSLDLQKQRQDEAKALLKKQIEDAKKNAAEQKAILDQQIKFRRDYSAAYIDSILDQYDKEREQAKANIDQKIQDLQNEKGLSLAAEKERNDVIILLRQNLYQQLQDIDHKREADRAALIFEGQQKLTELQADSTAKEIEISRLGEQQKEKEINEQFKNEGALRVKLLTALHTNQAAVEKKINDDAAIKKLSDDEERAVLEVETAAKFIPGFAKVEEQKQIEVLKVKLKFAKDSLGLLLSQGNAENSLVVLQAKKQIDDLQKSLGEATTNLKNSGGGIDLFSVLGLDPNDEQRKAVNDALKTSLDSVHQITDFIIGQYQRQIDKKQEVIDAENKGISDLEKSLDDEKKLRDAGLANNVDNIQAELDAKKKQRDEDIKQQEDLQKKQQSIQRAQLALDTAVQLSNLITSATKIFKSLADIPFVGVPLAIATIALMFGSFTAAKIKAFQAISDGQKFEKGGWIEGGKSHSTGGKKFYSKDGEVRELESGEFVMQKTQAEKHAAFLEALNDDRLSGMNDEALRAMFQNMGIEYAGTEPREGIKIVREKEIYMHEVALMPNDEMGQGVKSIDKNISFLADRERKRVDRWTEGDFNYIQTGSKIIKSPRK